MAIFSIFDISGSALNAQSQRMNVSASNLANAESLAGPDGQPYRAKQVVFQARTDGGASGVDVAKVVESSAEFKREFDPGNPFADDEGYVTLPNVEPVHEMVNMMSASRSYQANVEVMNTAKQLMLKTLSLGEK